VIGVQRAAPNLPLSLWTLGCPGIFLSFAMEDLVWWAYFWMVGENGAARPRRPLSGSVTDPATLGSINELHGAGCCVLHG
jgi:hypothetical protein